MSLVHLHLLLNHVPVVGILFVLLGLVVALRMRSSAFGKLALFMLTGIALVTAIVYFTGEPAEDAVEKIAGVSESVIHDHEEAAEAAFIVTGFAGVLALCLLWWFRQRELPRWTLVMSLVATLGVSGLMAWTANLGGQIRHSEIRTGISTGEVEEADEDNEHSSGTSSGEGTMTTTGIEIPKSVQREHEAIHSALVSATKAPGKVGVAASALATVLHPHFVREEEIALPPLGLLVPLAAGETPAESTEVLAMSDALRRELPVMLEEHGRIRAAVEELKRAARADGAPQYEQLAEQLALHAQTEEEVLYPAAVLVGDVIRVRMQKK